jgi:hypothetical protein
MPGHERPPGDHRSTATMPLSGPPAPWRAGFTAILLDWSAGGERAVLPTADAAVMLQLWLCGHPKAFSPDASIVSGRWLKRRAGGSSGNDTMVRFIRVAFYVDFAFK